MAHQTFDPPSPFLLGLESLSFLERGFFSIAAHQLLPRCTNDSSPVLVLPGFTASDRSTRPLRLLLREKGYAVHGWGLGVNVGPHPHVVDGLSRRLTDLAERYGTRVSLVGWSLGGIYARELARADPDRVCLVVTLGSPYRFRSGDRGHTSELYNAVAPRHDPFPGRAVPEERSPPLTVPATSIYTRTDGIVRWQACVEPAGPQRENVEVIGTHNGLGFNVAALYAVADRMNLPSGTWTSFVPPPYLRHLYPPPSAGHFT
jgi:pimeloyl-ACP methyl ester carboxylesterase